MRINITILATAVTLSACTSAVYLRNPKTGEEAKCGPYDARPINSFSSAQREAHCVNDFKEQGFVRTSK